MQTDLRLKIIQNHAIKNGIQWQIAILFSVLICLKNGQFATFVVWSFQLKLPYYKNSEWVVSENNHVLPENIVLMYSKIFLNSKFKFTRKCQNKSVCVRRLCRCIFSLDAIKLLAWYLSRFSMLKSCSVHIQRMIGVIHTKNILWNNLLQKWGF